MVGYVLKSYVYMQKHIELLKKVLLSHRLEIVKLL